MRASAFLAITAALMTSASAQESVFRMHLPAPILLGVDNGPVTGVSIGQLPPQKWRQAGSVDLNIPVEVAGGNGAFDLEASGLPRGVKLNAGRVVDAPTEAGLFTARFIAAAGGMKSLPRDMQITVIEPLIASTRERSYRFSTGAPFEVKPDLEGVGGTQSWSIVAGEVSDAEGILAIDLATETLPEEFGEFDAETGTISGLPGKPMVFEDIVLQASDSYDDAVSSTEPFDIEIAQATARHWLALRYGSGGGTSIGAVRMYGGSVYIAGQTGFGGKSYGFVAKIDPRTAETIWMTGLTWGSTAVGVFDMEIDGSGIYLLSGYTPSSARANDILVGKVSHDGTSDWWRGLGDHLLQMYSSIAVSGTDVYVGGYASTSTATSRRMQMFKLGKDGSRGFEKNLSAGSDAGQLYDIGYANGHVYGVGRVKSGSFDDMMVLRMSADGTDFLVRGMGVTNAHESLERLVVTSSGIYVSGTYALGGHRPYIAKLTPVDLNVEWGRRLQGVNVSTLAMAGDGASVAAAYLNQGTTTGADAEVIKFGSDGTLQMHRVLRGQGDDRVQNLDVSASGVLVSGYAGGINPGGLTGFLAHLPADGSGVLQSGSNFLYEAYPRGIDVDNTNFYGSYISFSNIGNDAWKVESVTATPIQWEQQSLFTIE